MSICWDRKLKKCIVFCWFSLSIERSWRVRSAELRFAPLVIPPLEIARGRAARVVFRRETKPSRRKTFDSAQPPDPSLLNAPTVPAPWITPNFLLQPLAKLLPSLGDSVFQGRAEKPPLSPSHRPPLRGAPRPSRDGPGLKGRGAVAFPASSKRIRVGADVS